MVVHRPTGLQVGGKERNMNARFWTWTTGGFVKLALRPGQSLTQHEGGAHEEGCSYTHTTWTLLSDGYVVCETVTNGRDCDGPHSSYSKRICAMENLSARVPYWSDDEVACESIRLPEWLLA